MFHIELSAGGFSKPPDWWYSKKALGGGAFYYWGPHAIDWVLDLKRTRMTGVTGFYHKLLWKDLDCEDHTRAIIRFNDGTSADVCHSHVSLAGKPLWRILGTQGAIVDTGSGGNVGYEKTITGPSGGSLTLTQRIGGQTKTTQVPYLDSDWVNYWHDMAAHVLDGGPAPVSGEEGRRTIAVFEAAEKSAASGQTEPVAFE